MERKRSLIERRKRVGDRKEPCGTPLLIGKQGEADPSTITEMDWSDRKLEISLQSEGENPKDGSL